MKKILSIGVCLFFLVIFANYSLASDSSAFINSPAKTATGGSSSAFFPGKETIIMAQNPEGAGTGRGEKAGSEAGIEQAETIPDPLEAYNRFNHEFNDKVYFHLLKPVAKKYGAVMPERVRISVQKFFLNLYAPVRFINCGLQGDKKGAFTELSRFAVNTTLGIGGFFDPAKSLFKLEMREEDFGQTLGCFMGPKFYLNWPFLGPSSLRDSIGSIVDLFIVPSYYVLSHSPYSYIYMGAKTLEIINQTSLTIGEYEQIKESALDPYVAVRDAYFQYREDLIRR